MTGARLVLRGSGVALRDTRPGQSDALSLRRADGPDEISYCAENAINPDGYFTPRGAVPVEYSESAAEPGDWTSSRVHSSWTWNMYEKP